MYGVLDRGVLLLELLTNGRSFALDFIFPGQRVLSSVRLGSSPFKGISFSAIEESALSIWSRGAIESISGTVGWAALQRQLVDHASNRSSERFLSLFTRSAVERYGDMRREFPDSWQRLPQHLIASYLGVTPQYLCRLKRLANHADKSA